MRQLALRRFCAAVLVVGAVVALHPARSGGDADRRTRELVKQLGSPDFHAREAASDELKLIGEKALPDIVKAGSSADPEVRTRAQWLVAQVLREAGASRSTGMELRPARVREFQMGSPKGEAGRRADEDQHPVALTKSFLLGAREVTQAEYEKVTGANPSWFTGAGGGKDKIAKFDTGKFPVEQVTWFDAVAFCNALSKLDGFEPYYKLADEKREKGALVSAAVTVRGGNGYRLPTEAEWEFACRGTTETAFSFGPRVLNGREANFKSQFSGGYGGNITEFLGRTTTTGSYSRTRWGHHDMHGNVAEWCGDWYDADYYATAPRIDPPGPAKGTHRVVRGGSWLVENTSCRSAARASQAPDTATYTTGFRVARSPY